MNQNDFVSVDHLISSVTTLVSDSDFKKGLSRGHYESWVQKALQYMALETYYKRRRFHVEIPQNCQVKFPPDMFNIREVYVYNGTLCNPQQTQVVHWKRLFNNMADGTGYTARIKDDGSNPNDMFLPNQSRYSMSTGNYYGTKYYWNMFEDTFMLSRECLGYKYLCIVANTMGGEIGDRPEVPRFFENAVTDWVKIRFYEVMKGRDPRLYRSLWADAKADFDVSMKEARKLVKSMDTAQKESLEDYFSSLYHK